MAPRILLFGNPTAQSGKAAAYLERALRAFDAEGAEATLLHTEPEGRTVSVVTRAVDERAPDVVVYMGGDGTFNEVARGILAAGARPPMGMLPMGTANDQGRSFGLRPGHRAIEANVRTILAGHLTHLDVGDVEVLAPDGAVIARTQFFDCVGWGMSPEILAQRNRDRAKVGKIPILRELYRDQAIFMGAALDRFLASFTEPSGFDAEIVCDGETHRYDGLTDLFINNTPIYAGEWLPDRRAVADDGKMELVPMQGRRDWISKSIRDLTVFPLSQEDLDVIGVTHSVGFAGASFDIRLSRSDGQPVPGQLDGEEWMAGAHFRVETRKNALPLITPAEFVPPWAPTA